MRSVSRVHLSSSTPSILHALVYVLMDGNTGQDQYQLDNFDKYSPSWPMREIHRAVRPFVIWSAHGPVFFDVLIRSVSPTDILRRCSRRPPCVIHYQRSPRLAQYITYMAVPVGHSKSIRICPGFCGVDLAVRLSWHRCRRHLRVLLPTKVALSILIARLRPCPACVRTSASSQGGFLDRSRCFCETLHASWNVSLPAALSPQFHWAECKYLVRMPRVGGRLVLQCALR